MTLLTEKCGSDGMDKKITVGINKIKEYFGKHPWGKRICVFAIYFLLTIAVFMVAIIVSGYAREIAGKWIKIVESTEDWLIGLTEGFIAAVAAVMVLRQLKSSGILEKHQNDIEEARFILEYNRSFIEDKEMGVVEHYLQCLYTGETEPEIKDYEQLKSKRQQLVNYMVYLEGVASCIQSGTLSFEHFDNLFAYRFFLAMNHPEVQKLEICEYPKYYRGCYKLYEQWFLYRARTELYDNILDFDIPMMDKSLKYKDLTLDGTFYRNMYHDYAEPKIRIKNTGEGLVAVDRVTNKEYGELLFCGPQDKMQIHIGRAGADYSARIIICELINTFLAIKIEDAKFVEKQSSFRMAIPKSEQQAQDSWLGRFFDVTINNKREEHIENSLLYWSLFSNPQTVVPEENRKITYRQLSKAESLSREQLEEIVELVYGTDEYIFPDMFGSIANAKKILPDLIEEGNDVMFCYDNLFVAEKDGHILGLCLWSEGELDWKSDALKAMAQNMEVVLPNTVEKVEQEYISVTPDSDIGNCIKLWNLCVSEAVRGQGIGKGLLTELFKQFPGREFELCVLAKNKKAILLYESCGFEIVKLEEAYPKEKENHNRYVMLKSEMVQ